MTRCQFHERCKADALASFADIPELRAMIERRDACNVKPHKREACEAYRGYAVDRAREAGAVETMAPDAAG